MRGFVFRLAFFLIVTTCLSQKSYHQDAIKYLELNGTEQQYNEAIDQMFDLLKRQYNSQGVPETVWQELQKVKGASIQDIKSLLVSVYKSSFSHKDIKELIAFYKLSEDQQKKELPQFLSSEVGQKIQNQGDSLKSRVGEVSELWSRDLYNETIEKLEAKGYPKPQ